MWDAFYLVSGIVLLALGGEALIRGALGIAQRLGMSPLLSGLLIVGFGTSMPEMVVSLKAVLGGQSDIAIGNVVGSNIANVLLILGICALIAPITVTPSALRRDALVVVAATSLVVALAWGGELGQGDALILLVALAGYLIWAYQSESAPGADAAETSHPDTEQEEQGRKPLWWSVIATFLGLALLIGGSQVLLKGAVGVAQSLGVSKAVIGLTLVAVGTSLPELTVSVLAALRKSADVAVGNVLGSNIFNLLCILGVSALVQPLDVSGRIADFDQWIMLGVTLLLFVFLYTGRIVSRVEGAALMICYLAYVGASYTVIAG